MPFVQEGQQLVRGFEFAHRFGELSLGSVVFGCVDYSHGPTA
jgi:hypothetical protein